jgi:hypothetical protein
MGDAPPGFGADPFDFDSGVRFADGNTIFTRRTRPPSDDDGPWVEFETLKTAVEVIEGKDAMIADLKAQILNKSKENRDKSAEIARLTGQLEKARATISKMKAKEDTIDAFVRGKEF